MIWIPSGVRLWTRPDGPGTISGMSDDQKSIPHDDGQLSKRSGIPVSTIKYYFRKNYYPGVLRLTGQRLLRKDHINQLRAIKTCRGKDFPAAD